VAAAVRQWGQIFHLDGQGEHTVARKKTGLLEDLFAIATTVPWWVECVLAVVAYGLSHRYATAEAATSVVPGKVGQLARLPFCSAISLGLARVVEPRQPVRHSTRT
jgi:hypothetical protein